MMENHQLFKDEKCQDYYFATSSLEETVIIDIKSSKAFKCFWTENVFRQAKENLGSTRQEIENWLQQMRTSSKDFAIAISEDCKNLIWKKNGRVKVRIAEVPIETIDFHEALKKLFEIGLKDKIDKEMHKQNFERIADERKDMILRMKTMTEDKTKLESTLYSKFLAILNAKQDYIAELLSRIKELEEDPMETCKPSTSTNEKHRIHTISSSSEGSEDNTEASNKCDSSLNLNNSQNLFNL